MHLKYAKMLTIVGQENLKLGDNNEQKRRQVIAKQKTGPLCGFYMWREYRLMVEWWKEEYYF